MSAKCLLFALQRCVAVGRVPAGIAARGGALSAGRGLLQRGAGTPTARRPAPLLGFCTKPGAPWEDEYPPLPAYQADPEPEKKEVYIVQVKGLMWSCTAQDLLQFFSECRIRDGVKGIHLTVNRQGRPSGRAFIEMEHEEDVNKALEKHRQYLGPRYVEVYEVSNSEAEDILKKPVQTRADGGVVRLRGLPFTCTEADIVQFFSGLDIVANGITIITDRKGRNSGGAFVQFSSQEAADEALQRDREVMGNRYIEVFPSRVEDIQSGWRRKTSLASPQTGPQSWDSPQTGPQSWNSPQTGPQSLDSPQTGPQSWNSPQTGPRSWNSPQTGPQSWNSPQTGPQSWDSPQTGPQSWTSPQTGPQSLDSPQTGPQSWNRRTVSASETSSKTGPPQSSALPLHYVHMRGLPFQVSGEDVVQFFSPLVVSKILIECGPDGKPSGEADVYFSCHQDATAAMSRDRELIGDRYIELFLNSVPEHDGR